MGPDEPTESASEKCDIYLPDDVLVAAQQVLEPPAAMQPAGGAAA